MLSPGYEPSKWNVFRLFWGGQGKQVVQVNPKNTTSRRTRWALRVLRYLANFWSTLGPAFDQRNRGCQSRRLESSPPNRGQDTVPVLDFPCECIQSLSSMSERLSVPMMCVLGNKWLSSTRHRLLLPVFLTDSRQPWISFGFAWPPKEPLLESTWRLVRVINNYLISCCYAFSRNHLQP